MKKLLIKITNLIVCGFCFCNTDLCYPITLSGTWQSFWDQSSDTRAIILEEYKSAQNAESWLGPRKKSRNILSITTRNGPIVLISGLSPFIDGISSNRDTNQYFDFCDVLLGIEKSYRLKDLLKTINKFNVNEFKFSNSASEVLSSLYGILISKDGKIDVRLKLSDLQRLLSIPEKIFQGNDQTVLLKLKKKINHYNTLKNDGKTLFTEYLTILKNKFLPTIHDIIERDITPASHQIDNLLSIIPTLEFDRILDCLLKDQTVKEVLAYMHTETLYAYILQETENIGEIPKLKPLLKMQNIILSKRDMCNICEECLAKLFKTHPFFIASIESFREFSDYFIGRTLVPSLKKIPIDADNSAIVVNRTHGTFTKGLEILQKDISKHTLSSHPKLNDNWECIRELLSPRTKALFPQEIFEDIFEETDKLINIPLKDICRTSQGQVQADMLWHSRIICNTDIILQSIRAHQLVFVELLEGTQKLGLQEMVKLLKISPIPILERFIDYLKPFRPEVSSSASALSSSVHSTSLDKKE